MDKRGHDTMCVDLGQVSVQNLDNSWYSHRWLPTWRQMLLTHCKVPLNPSPSLVSLHLPLLLQLSLPQQSHKSSNGFWVHSLMQTLQTVAVLLMKLYSISCSIPNWCPIGNIISSCLHSVCEGCKTFTLNKYLHLGTFYNHNAHLFNL